MAKFLYIFFIVAFSLTIPAQVCPKVAIKDQNGNETITVDCGNPLQSGSLTLTAEAPQLRSTETYTVSARSYEPPVLYNEGTRLQISQDDQFLPAQDLPFNFCFFGKSYNKIVIGTNGVLSFDTSLQKTRNVANFDETNPNPVLPLTSIFGAMHHMNFVANEDSDIYWTVTGEEGCRKFIVSYYRGKQIGCEERSTFQIVLHENTNVIEVFVEQKKPFCEENFKNSLIGIINENGDLGYSPPGRNTGVWSAENEAWVFTLENPVSPTFSWFNSAGTQIGTGQTITVTPSASDTYSVRVSYPTCTNSTVLSDQISLNFAPDYPLAKDASVSLCSEAGSAVVNLHDYNASVTSQNAGNFVFRYYRTAAEAQAGGTPLADEQNLTADAVFYARIENPFNPSCFSVAKISFKVTSEALAKNLIDLCDAGNDGFENINFADYHELLLPGFTGTVEFYFSETEARLRANRLGITTVTSGSEVWLRAEKDGCTNILGPVRFNFKPTAEVNSPLSLTLSMCDINFDGSEPFDWQGTFDAAVTSTPGVIISYHSTLEDARALRNPLTRVREVDRTVYVAVQKDGCITVATIDVNVTFTGVNAKNASKDVCFDGTQDTEVDLDALSDPMLVAPRTGIAKTYHATRNAAENGTMPIDPNQVISSDGNLVTQTFFVRFELSPDCYTVRELTVRLIHPVAAQTDFQICDFGNDNTETITLGQFTNAIKGTQNATVNYYTTVEDASANINSITSYILTRRTELFVRISSFGCSEVYPILLELTPTPDVETQIEKTVNNYCDNNADGREPFNLRSLEAEIYSGSGVTFTYFLAYNENTRTLSSPISRPEAFVTGASATVFVKITNNATQCYSVSTLRLNINFLPPITLKPATLSKCDTEFNANETFQLEEAVPQIFDASQNTWPLSQFTITFYESQAEANAGGSEGQIASGSITTRASTVQVFARFEHTTLGCYSVAPINLLSVLPPKTISSIITVCDNDLDGMYDVNLLNFTHQMVETPNSENRFTFYMSREDAVADINQIQNPDNFEVQPFPSRIWVRSENLPGCYDVNYVTFRFGTPTEVPQDQFIINDVCDVENDGVENLNLTRFEQIDGARYEYFPSLEDLQNNTNRIANPEDYLFNATSNTAQRIFVKVTDGALCPALFQIRIALKKAPVFPTDEIYYFCPEGSVNIRPDFQNLQLIAYEWRDASGNIISTTRELTGIGSPGKFTLTVTAADGCVHTASFEVRQKEVPVITRIEVSGNVYTVVAAGSQPILYRANDGAWQAEPVFRDLPLGVNTFYVRFEEDTCIGKPRQAVVLDIPNAITPNEDGINDIWRINGLQVFDGQFSSLKVADRFGQIIFQQNSNSSFSWNGHYNSRPVPSGTYWYVIKLPDGRQQTGWLVVKNRN